MAQWLPLLTLVALCVLSALPVESLRPGTVASVKSLKPPIFPEIYEVSGNGMLKCVSCQLGFRVTGMVWSRCCGSCDCCSEILGHHGLRFCSGNLRASSHIHPHTTHVCTHTTHTLCVIVFLESFFDAVTLSGAHYLFLDGSEVSIFISGSEQPPQSDFHSDSALFFLSLQMQYTLTLPYVETMQSGGLR